jgi:hypothetical protein
MLPDRRPERQEIGVCVPRDFTLTDNAGNRSVVKGCQHMTVMGKSHRRPETELVLDYSKPGAEQYHPIPAGT